MKTVISFLTPYADPDGKQVCGVLGLKSVPDSCRAVVDAYTKKRDICTIECVLKLGGVQADIDLHLLRIESQDGVPSLAVNAVCGTNGKAVRRLAELIEEHRPKECASVAAGPESAWSMMMTHLHASLSGFAYAVIETHRLGTEMLAALERREAARDN